MATSKALPLQERVQVKNTLWKASDLVILLLLLSLLCYRLSLLHRHGFVWLAACLCESWFTFLWLLNMNHKWNQVKFVTYPDRISKRYDDLPAVDMFVTTADPELEPPTMTVNTVLSLLAVEYPARRLACYVSDDGCSAVTYYALVEAAEFARSWVPFCKKYRVRVRAPFRCFSGEPDAAHLPTSSDFRRDWQVVKNKYEELVRRIDMESRAPLECLKGEGARLSKFERGNHPSIVKVIWENSDALADAVPHLIYVSREKRPTYPHHYKAGAMNVLGRVSGVMTNAPFVLNVDCDMFANNPEVVLHGMCLLLGSESERKSGFAQAPQRFYGGIRDDPFGNEHVVFQHYGWMGENGLECPIYAGTGCFHRRKAIYGEAPELEEEEEAAAAPSKLRGTARGTSFEVFLYSKRPSTWTSIFTVPVPPPHELQRRFGSSREMQESAAWIISGAGGLTSPNITPANLTVKLEAATEVASGKYEVGTCWGRETGWVYGTATEDIQTGLRIHSRGWRSVSFDPEPPAFLGCVPLSGATTMTQCKRWAAGLLETMLHRDGPLSTALAGKLALRPCLVYVLWGSWGMRSAPELSYALLAPYCAFTDASFLPKASEPTFVIPALLAVFYNAYTLTEYLDCELSVRAWWNNQRMQRIKWTTPVLFGLLGVVSKVLGLSETTFEVTAKEQTATAATPEAAAAVDKDLGRFTFDSSPMYVPGTALVLLNSAAAAAILSKLLRSPAGGVIQHGNGPGFAELVCSVWVVMSFWPFVRGFFGRGSYGLPWSTILKGSVLSSLFLAFCKWSS